ncbi:hypothetical protein [Caloranaerobacter ferrireducens]|uniref:hypothetical protein n=1 Tax=Caloranaerobacter ferrireducens TaxID=1323370 RepID=UPI00159F09D6|nr:hypothetical protein [Caloranaerobacter ferrireducens]
MIIVLYKQAVGKFRLLPSTYIENSKGLVSMVFRLNYPVDSKKRENKKEEKDYERILSIYERCTYNKKKTLIKTLKTIKDKAKRLYN